MFLPQACDNSWDPLEWNPDNNKGWGSEWWEYLTFVVENSNWISLIQSYPPSPSKEPQGVNFINILRAHFS